VKGKICIKESKDGQKDDDGIEVRVLKTGECNDQDPDKR
jgi:hypothetical protein